ncbi:RCC1/BLIP-II protein, partial [Aureobasidium sp. EXF-8845]
TAREVLLSPKKIKSKPTQQQRTRFRTKKRQVLHLAVAGNGHVAVILTSASSPRNSILEFTSFDKFREWFDDEVNDLHGPSFSHTVPGRVTQLVANVTGFVCLTRDGNVYTWGDARHSSLGRSVAETEAKSPGLVECLAGIQIKKIASDGWMTAALSEDGAVYLFGTGTPGTQHSLSCLAGLNPVEAALVDIEERGEPLDFLDVAMGDGHVLLLAQDGRVFAAGDNRNGQLGLGQKASSYNKDWREVMIPKQHRCLAVFAGPKASFFQIAGKYHDMLTMHAQALPDTNLLGITFDDPDAASDNVRECTICTKEQPLNSFPVASSVEHYHDPNSCKKCFNRYIVGHIDSGHARITCVECSERLRYKDIQAIVSKTSLKKYDKVLTKAFVEDDVDFHYCMSAKCKSGQIHIGGEDTPMFTCHACEHMHCIQCDIPWHAGETCDEYQARHDEEVVATGVVIRGTSRACPGGCGARIERNGGCPHMQCTRCETHFCWHCLGVYNDHDAHQNCAIDNPARPEALPAPSEEIQYRENMRQARQNLRDFDNEQAEALILGTTTLCPKCNVPIEKDGGCDHMTCTQCNFQFCYQCSANYATILKHDNRSHKRNCIYYAALGHGFVMPAKMAVDESSTAGPVASAQPRRAVAKRTIKNKPVGVTKKKAVVVKKKKAVVAPAVVRGTRTGLRSSTAASTAAVRGPVTRSQTTARFTG